MKKFEFETTLKHLLETEGSLTEINELDLPFKISYKVSRILAKVSPILKTYRKVVEDKIKEYGEEDEKTGNYSIDKTTKKGKKFTKEVDELLDTEETIVFAQLTLDSLGEELPIKGRILSDLSWIFSDIEEDEEPKKGKASKKEKKDE